MQQVWFRKAGFAYVPVHAMGFMVSIAALLFLVPVYMAITRTAHSVTDGLYQLFVYTTCTAFWWKWIAEKTS